MAGCMAAQRIWPPLRMRTAKASPSFCGCYGRAVEDDRLSRVKGRSTDELLAALMDSQPGSPAHEQAKAAIQVRIAEAQREAARDNLRWAKIVGVSTALATVIALIALFVSLF